MKKLNLSELEVNILGWSHDKDLIHVGNAPKQKLKLIEELGETSKAILKNDVKEIKDGLGDAFVVLVILSHQIGYRLHLESFLRYCDDTYSSDPATLITEIIQYSKLESLGAAICTLYHLAETLNYDLTDCANIAYNEIKDRKGETINGTFIREK